MNDPNSTIDNSILWEVVTSDSIENSLFKNGLNIVILEKSDYDSNVKIHCPPNIYSTPFYEDRYTLILIKKMNIYEPVYYYENTKKLYTHLFKTNNEKIPKSIKFGLEVARTNMLNMCKPRKSLSLHVKIPLDELQTINILEKYSVPIINRVFDYSARIVGLNVRSSFGDVYVPCFPSSMEIMKVSNILNESLLITSVDDTELFNTYDETILRLDRLYNLTNQELRCDPYKKIIHDEKVIGIITICNNFVPISDPPSIYEVKDDLIIEYGNNDIEANKEIAFNEIDTEQQKIIQSVILESKYFSIFRTTVRYLLQDPNNHPYRAKIKKILQSSNLYDDKVKDIYYLLQELCENYVEFKNLSINDILTLDKKDINICLSEIDDSLYCKNKGDRYNMVVPKFNLKDRNIFNNIFYFTKLADQLIRFIYIRNFVLEVDKYYTHENIDYSVNNDELLLLDSYITNDFLTNK